MLQPCHLKSNHCFAVLDGDANIHPGGKAGVYFHDTRHISEYRWDFGALTRLAEADQVNWAFRHWGLFDVRAQRLSVCGFRRSVFRQMRPKNDASRGWYGHPRANSNRSTASPVAAQFAENRTSPEPPGA